MYHTNKQKVDQNRAEEKIMTTSERQKIDTRFSVKAEMRIMMMEMQSKTRPGMRIGQDQVDWCKD